MTLASVLAMLNSLAPALEPLVLGLEVQGQAELKALIGSVSSPDLKLFLQALDSALDSFAKAEVAKI